MDRDFAVDCLDFFLAAPFVDALHDDALALAQVRVSVKQLALYSPVRPYAEVVFLVDSEHNCRELALRHLFHHADACLPRKQSLNSAQRWCRRHFGGFEI
jgi:hypothetical protein